MLTDSLPSLYSDFLTKYGTSMILQRAGVSDLSLRGSMRKLAPKELTGDLLQGDRRVVLGSSEIASASWPVPIRKGDKIVSSGKTFTVIDAESVEIDNVVVRWNLTVRG